RQSARQTGELVRSLVRRLPLAPGVGPTKVKGSASAKEAAMLVAPSRQIAFSVPQVAARCGISSRQVYDLCAQGELGHLRIGGLIRVRLVDLEAYEARQWHAP